MKFFLPLLTAACSLSASTVSIQNLNSTETAGYALFDSSGSLLADSLTDNIRLGSFNTSFNAAGAWDLGDLNALNLNFNQFGSTFGIFNGFNGGFQAALADVNNDFSSDTITLWVSSTNSFSDDNSEYLIFTFDSKVFPADAVNGSESLIFGVDSGVFLSATNPAGELGNFNHDFGFGGGSLPGFNTVNVIPEPSTYAAILGLLALSFVATRRKGDKGSNV
jgi:hypothetical protein